MFKQMLSILLCMAFLFCVGCDGQTQTGTTNPQGGAAQQGNQGWFLGDDAAEAGAGGTAESVVYESCEGVYQLKELTEVTNAVTTATYSDNEIYLNQSFYSSGSDGVSQVTPDSSYDNRVYDLDGNYLRGEKGKFLDREKNDGEQPKTLGEFWFEENGTAYYLYTDIDWEREAVYVQLRDADANIVREVIVPGPFGGLNPEYLINETYYMVMSQTQQFLVYDRNLNIVADQQLYQAVEDITM